MGFRTIGLVFVLASQMAFAGAPDTRVVEFYNKQLYHYFITADASEAGAIDAGVAGAGWVRTGRSFGGWLQKNNAPADAHAVCRFYSSAANSHFYTADAAECASLKALEQTQRAAAAQPQAPFTGWSFESVAFVIQTPDDGRCPDGTEAVARLFNRGATKGKLSNHRFVSDSALAQDMVDRGWLDEGTGFCAPVQEVTGTSAPDEPASDSFPALADTWRGSSDWVFTPEDSDAIIDTGIALTLTITSAGAISGSGNGCTLAGTIDQGDGFQEFFTGNITLAGCAHAEFNGTFPLAAELLGDLLVFHLHGEQGNGDLNMLALLGPSSPSAGGQSGSWSGTVTWVAIQQPTQEDTSATQVEQNLNLSLQGTVLSGSGFGCVFTGAVQGGNGPALRGTVIASGCTEPAFNGTYTEVELLRAGPVLVVSMKKGTMSEQDPAGALIVGALFVNAS